MIQLSLAAGNHKQLKKGWLKETSYSPNCKGKKGFLDIVFWLVGCGFGFIFGFFFMHGIVFYRIAGTSGFFLQGSVCVIFFLMGVLDIKSSGRKFSKHL